MRMLLRPLTLAALTIPALLPLAAPANAQLAGDFQDARVEVSPGCAGTVRAEVSVIPLPTHAAGVGVGVLFRGDRQDPACSATTTVSWRNTASGATGSQDVTVSSVPAPGGIFPTDHGYARVVADTGPGTIVVTTTTNPGEVSVTV
ncbi:hypothetical protein NONO_c39040 [Nocardia nova SH22a]|uniref:Secreted protein n=1 Tax=Nocardia nova SH22a TaxID=1415166 RepID=W5TI56_9NOCA|nr:hypothetical protein [Nocardia nova]AHH18688.1 hypothetical protein NONO_c39040 [Nocardia nova SH22a]